MNASRYYVFGKNTPTVLHPDLPTAEAEATRLARLNPGIEFYVLRAIKGIRFSHDPFIITNYKK